VNDWTLLDGRTEGQFASTGQKKGAGKQFRRHDGKTRLKEYAARGERNGRSFDTDTD